MSATLPNISDLSKWMNGSLYTTQYRPVNLEVKVSFGKKLYKVENCANSGTSTPQLVFDRNIQQLTLNNSSPPKFPQLPQQQNNFQQHPQNLSNSLIKEREQIQENKNGLVGDEDGFLSLCGETLREEKSLMVFCSSKKRLFFYHSSVT